MLKLILPTLVLCLPLLTNAQVINQSIIQKLTNIPMRYNKQRQLTTVIVRRRRLARMP